MLNWLSHQNNNTAWVAWNNNAFPIYELLLIWLGGEQVQSNAQSEFMIISCTKPHWKINVYKLIRHPARKYCFLNKFHTYKHL